MFSNIRNRFSTTQIIAVGFIIIVLIGAALLMTPLASRSGTWTDFITAAFTSVSATCVTGLVVVNTYDHWTIFGQVVILCLIQIGGLGFMTFSFQLSLLMRRRISLTERGMLKESMNVFDIAGMVKLAKIIVKGTILFEGIGTIILTISFLPRMGFGRALYNGVFHSVSAFCNAGFDLMGRYGSSSMTIYNNNWGVCLTIVLLIIIGGIGFFVWKDMSEHKFHFRKYALHSKIALSTTAILVIGGTILFLILEQNNLFADMSLPQKILNALFSSVTPRTAGFNSVDTHSLTESSKLLTIILMFIGGCPGSTAGGIKVTTLAVMILYLRATLSRTDGVNIFGRRLEDEIIPKASVVFTMHLLLALIAIFIISCCESFSLTSITFEVISAISTVGMSTGITSSLCAVSKVSLIFLMYCGRVGSLSFALAFTDKKKLTHIRQPKAHINVG